jgi:hypothetical protein
MEDKRGIKHSRSPSAEGSPAPSDAKRSFHAALARRCSSMGGSRKAPVIDLSSSSDEEDLIATTSHDFEFAQRLFGELNCTVLGPLDDSKIIIVSNSDEEEVREEKTTDTKMWLLPLQSTLHQPPPLMPLRGQKMIIVMIRPPIRRLAVTTTVEVTPVSLRLARQEGAKAGVLQ